MKANSSEVAKDSQISNFDNPKYLKQEYWSPDKDQRMSSSSSSSSVCNSTSVDAIYNYSVRSLNATPRHSSSEASCNSQTSLITVPPMSVNLHTLEKKKGRVRKIFTSDCIKWFFQRRCLCSGKKSVQVEQELVVLSAADTRKAAPAADLYRTNQLVNHKLVQKAKERDRVLTPDSNHQQLIFSSVSSHHHQYCQPPLSGSRGFSSLQVLNDATTMEDDMASDASSDLFEIESFPTHTSHPLSDSLEESQTDMIYYEPMISTLEYYYYESSKACIGWSVTSAEGFDLHRPSMSTFSIF